MSKDKRFVMALVGFAFFAFIIEGYITFGTVEIVTVNVVKTERVTTGSGDNLSSKYLVFTESETFENTDSILWVKFNSSDIHGELTEGEHTLKVYGFRIPFLSMYRNIVEVK